MIHNDVDFQGTLPELIAWVEATFKNPNGIQLRVNVNLSAPPADATFAAQQRAMRALYDRDMSAKTARVIADRLKAGLKIDAIKELRTATGLGLSEAKRFIEQHFLPLI